MVSVVEVRASRDLSHAHIYISVLGDDQAKKDCAAALRSASGFIRREITSRIRLRISPELHFIFDDSIERGIRMSRLIDQAIGGQAGHD
jgi:ribosome-binding factor A